MSIKPRAWILNLDAERELEARQHYATTRAMSAVLARESKALLGTLVGENDLILREEDFAPGGRALKSAAGLVGVAWSPTPRALAQLRAAGAEPLAAPEVDVLRLVNSRPFAAAVRAPLARGSFRKHVASDLEGVLAQLAQPAPLGWMARRTFGAAGRGRRRIAPGIPSAPELAWIQASLRVGPIVIEPWVEVVLEYTRSAWLYPRGRMLISPPCFQKTTAQGAWTFTQRAELAALSHADDAELERAVEAAGQALHAAGYFGPFGIDAYRHRSLFDPARSELNPLSEINARFTMDWATAMAAIPQTGAARLTLETLL